MPVHDWTRVDAGVFHAFHHAWITDISRALNRGVLPSEYYALPEKIARGLGPDVYAAKAKAVTIHHLSNHRIVAMVEIVSPGNKNGQNGLNAFVRKAREAHAAGIHLVLIDLFPPSSLDPKGIHGAVWGVDYAPDNVLPNDKQLTCVSYVASPAAEPYIGSIGIGDALPDMPLFLTLYSCISLPLEETYQSAWEGMPAYWRDVLTSRLGRGDNR